MRFCILIVALLLFYNDSRVHFHQLNGSINHFRLFSISSKSKDCYLTFRCPKKPHACVCDNIEDDACIFNIRKFLLKATKIIFFFWTKAEKKSRLERGENWKKSQEGYAEPWHLSISNEKKLEVRCWKPSVFFPTEGGSKSTLQSASWKINSLIVAEFIKKYSFYQSWRGLEYVNRRVVLPEGNLICFLFVQMRWTKASFVLLITLNCQRRYI